MLNKRKKVSTEDHTSEEMRELANIVNRFLSTEVERLYDTHQYTKELALIHINLCRQLSKFNSNLKEIADGLERAMEEDPEEYEEN